MNKRTSWKDLELLAISLNCMSMVSAFGSTGNKNEMIQPMRTAHEAWRGPSCAI